MTRMTKMTKDKGRALSEPENPGRAALLGEIMAHECTEMEPKYVEM